jgi:hypothetical protein
MQLQLYIHVVWVSWRRLVKPTRFGNEKIRSHGIVQDGDEHWQHVSAGNGCSLQQRLIAMATIASAASQGACLFPRPPEKYF